MSVRAERGIGFRMFEKSSKLSNSKRVQKDASEKGRIRGEASLVCGLNSVYRRVSSNLK